MIIRSEFIRLSGQAAHLTRTDTNRTVAIRIDLARDAPDDLLDMTRFFAAIARSNPRTERDLVHVKISPAHPLTDAQLVRALEVLEEEFCIAPSTPRGVVEHDKGDRPRHFHVLYPIVDPATGRAIRSEANYVKDELVSRRLEIAFGEPIVPGPRMAEVVEELGRRGQTAEAEALKRYTAVRSGTRFGHGMRQQAERLGVDLPAFAEKVFECWTRAAGSGQAFADGLAQCEMRLAAGNKAVLVLHDATGFSAPLARVLRQTTKARGAAVEIREPELRAIFPRLPAFDDARDAGLQKAAANGQRLVDAELARFAAEAIADEQEDLARRLNKVREAERRRRDEIRRSLIQRRAEIAALYCRRDRIRRARVNRAFGVARWAAAPAIRKTAFVAAAGIMGLAGGGLGAILVAGGLAVAILPTYERARMLAAVAAAERAKDASERGLVLRRLYSDFQASMSKPLDFRHISKTDRILVGFVAYCAVVGSGGELGTQHRAVLENVRRRIGIDFADQVRSAVLVGPAGGAVRMLAWYREGDTASKKALEAALRADIRPRSTRERE